MKNRTNYGLCVAGKPGVCQSKPGHPVLGNIYNEAFIQYIDELISQGKDERTAIMRALKVTFPAIYKAAVKQKKEESVLKYVRNMLHKDSGENMKDAG